MNRIFISFILIFLNIEITVGDSIIGLLPDFVGFILMAKGLSELTDELPKLKPFVIISKIMAYYTGIIYILQLFNISGTIGIYMILVHAVRLIISFVLCHRIIASLKKLEHDKMADFHTENLLYSLRFLCVGCCAALLMEYAGFNLPIRLIINGIPYFVFLYEFYRTRECMLAFQKK